MVPGSNPGGRTRIKLSEILPTDSAARSAERYGNTGSPPNFVFRFAPLESYFLNCIGNFCLRYLQCKLSNGALRNAPPRKFCLTFC
ncbi:hypothetical protein COS61_00675 [Candidatus Wolfebacteria bacterium CG03_land_8_20_14_0_80_40_12]|uniref:Uncharacterized protein n=1 Tax=Candidatus Wolfebacteria bacterium CG03_land_8_20_14_0_80_40_12 TaxID=1975069 RepID=A0A2M7B618_9BACT|nr:MAG: hypothetical protein COS61_00675 [Candidatus Wolfebacteria bacterium CG03_land_8_20_14_0_80_40_12]